jgi:hypothetical protein
LCSPADRRIVLPWALGRYRSASDPGHLRHAFEAWVEAGAPDTAAVEVNYEEEQWPAERLLGKLWHCTDIMPRTLCGEDVREAVEPVGPEPAESSSRPGDDRRIGHVLGVVGHG